MAGPAVDKGKNQEEDEEKEEHEKKRAKSSDECERQHFYDICYSCLMYFHDAMQDLRRVTSRWSLLSTEDRELCLGDDKNWAEAVKVRIEANANFLKLLPSPEVCGSISSRSQALAALKVPSGHVVGSHNSSKVRSTLRQFVRDWSAEGQAERDLCYKPLIEALLRHLPPTLEPGRRKPKVLCPGSGLGRLPFDLACLGYAAQQNEFSYHMILGSHLIFNRTGHAASYCIFPYALDMQNRKAYAHNLRPVRVPDISLEDVMPEGADFSMASGEFVTVYQEQSKAWDAVLTCFFLDTAKNVFLYIRTIAAIIRPGGFWINLGPLLYHYATVPSEISIELSWDEVRPAISKYFDFVQEQKHTALYTVNSTALRRNCFQCILFTAVRNETPVSGVSSPVF